MSTIVTRAGKGSALTHNEVDANFTNLNTDKLQSGDTVASLTITSADINGGTIDGAAIGSSSASTGAFTTVDATTVEVTNISAKDGTANITLADTTGIATFSKATVISTTDNTNAALTITQTGTGNALVVEDSANPDSTPFVINADGKVGIGTSSPIQPLNVVGTGGTVILLQADEGNATIVSRAHADSATLTGGIQLSKSRGTLAAPTAVQANNIIGRTVFNGYDGSSFIAAASIQAEVDGTPGSNDMPGRLMFSTTPDGLATPTERMRITSGGEVYIAGTTDQGAFNLQCNGTGVWGAGAYTNGSDARIKDNIAPIASGLDVVTKLNPVTYRYKESWTKDQSVQTGFIAQELRTALEGEVYVDGVVQQGGTEGYYSVAYQNIIPILTKAIQELKTELDATKAKVAALENA
jgi:hypothetical protein